SSCRVVQSMMSVEDNGKRAAMMKKEEIIGETPENELKISPKWMVFEPVEKYSKPLRTTISIENQDEYPIAFCVRTKVRHIPRFNVGYGILKENESISLDVIVPPSSEWNKSEDDIIAKHHKMVFENLRLPTGTSIPEDPKDRTNMGRQIFRATQNQCPFIRLYTKSNLVLLPIK
ncbi:dct-9, partial [Pristionchus pacificus]